MSPCSSAAPNYMFFAFRAPVDLSSSPLSTRNLIYCPFLGRHFAPHFTDYFRDVSDTNAWISSRNFFAFFSAKLHKRVRGAPRSGSACAAGRFCFWFNRKLELFPRR